MSISLGLGLGLTRGGAPSALGALTAYAPTPILGWVAPTDGSTGLAPSGGKATQVADSFGGAAVLAQATAGKQATIDNSTKLAGRPTLAFTNAGHTAYAAASGGITGNADHALIAVWKASNNSSSYAAIAGFGPDAGTISALGKVSTKWWFGGSGFTEPATGITDDLGWHVIAKLHASGQDRIYVDGRPLLTDFPGTYPIPYTQTYAVSSAAYGLGPQWAGGFYAPDGNLAGVAFYGSLSLSDLAIVHRWYALRLGLNQNPQIICKGDSLTRSAINSNTDVPSPWPQQLPTLLGKVGKVDVTNLGLFGEMTSQMLSAETTEVLQLYSWIRGITSPKVADTNWIVFMGGANDAMQGIDPNTTLATITSYANAARAQGFKFALLTTPAIWMSADPTVEVRRLALRSLLIAAAPSISDVFIDVGGSPHLATATDAQDLTYYQLDGVHLTQAGYDLIGALVAARLAGKV